MPSQLVDLNLSLTQPQRLHQIPPQRLDIPLNLPQPRLLQTPASLRKLINR